MQDESGTIRTPGAATFFGAYSEELPHPQRLGTSDLPPGIRRSIPGKEFLRIPTCYRVTN